MARPRKTTLNYFPVDVNFLDDERIVALSGKYGATVYSIIMVLTTVIYSKGYYIEWNELMKYKILSKLQGISEEVFDDCLSFLCKWDYFDKDLFAKGILTSVDIQVRYFEATKRWVKIDNPLYLLIQTERATTPEQPEEPTAVSLPISEETKVAPESAPMDELIQSMEGPEDERSQDKSDTETKAEVVRPSVEEITNFMKVKKLKKYNPVMDDVIAFIAYWDTRGWLIDGIPMANWRGAFVSWLMKKIKFGDMKLQSAVMPTPITTERKKEPERRCTPPTPEFLYKSALANNAPKPLIEMFKKQMEMQNATK